MNRINISVWFLLVIGGLAAAFPLDVAEDKAKEAQEKAKVLPIQAKTFHFLTQDYEECPAKLNWFDVVNTQDVRPGGDFGDQMRDRAKEIYTEAFNIEGRHYKLCVCIDFGDDCRILDGKVIKEAADAATALAAGAV